MENELLVKMNALLEELRKAKPEDKGELARRYAITITDFEKVVAYFKTYIVPEIA
jgi:hypothetical protein